MSLKPKTVAICDNCGDEFAPWSTLDRACSGKCSKAIAEDKAAAKPKVRRKSKVARSQPANLMKSNVIKSKKIRDAAKGQDCTMEVAGVCNHNPETVVHGHFPSEIATSKSTDISGGHICSACHDWIDLRNCTDREGKEFYMRRSQVRTITRLIGMGLVAVAGHGE